MVGFTPAQLAEVAALVAEDLEAFAQTGGCISREPTLAAYQRALALVLSLRSLQRDGQPWGVSMAAVAMDREDERDALAGQVGRLRQACRSALDDSGFNVKAFMMTTSLQIHRATHTILDA